LERRSGADVDEKKIVAASRNLYAAEVTRSWCAVILITARNMMHVVFNFEIIERLA